MVKKYMVYESSYHETEFAADQRSKDCTGRPIIHEYIWNDVPNQGRNIVL